MIKTHLGPENQVTIAVCGKYAELADCYVSVNEARRDAAATLNAKVDLEFIETDDFEKDPSRVRVLSGLDGLLDPVGFGSRVSEAKIKAVEYARTHKTPSLGICLGFELAAAEYARSLA